MTGRKIPVGLILSSLFYIFGCAQVSYNTKLHESIMYTSNENTSKLIMSTDDLDSYDEFGRTPLHIAVMLNNKEIVQKLIDHGANINQKTLHGHTPLSLSVRHSDLELTDFFIDAGAKINLKHSRSPLIEAIKFRRLDLCKKLIAKGADINAVDRFNESALFYAVYLDLGDLVQTLIANGAAINTSTAYGMTPLQAAAFTENKEIIRQLLMSGAKLHPDESNEKNIYSKAVLLEIIAGIYETEGRKNEAALAYAESKKFYDLGEKRFAEYASQLSMGAFMKVMGTILTAGLLTTPAQLADIGITRSNLNKFEAEDTDYMTSGIIALNATHPDYLENQLNPNNGEDTGVETHRLDESKKPGFSITKFYRRLSTAFHYKSIECSDKIKMLDGISPNSDQFISGATKSIPDYKDIGFIGADDIPVKLTIYRMNRFYGFAASAYFFIDGCYYGTLACNQFMPVTIKPGHHVFSLAHMVVENGYIKIADRKDLSIENGTKEVFLQMIHKKDKTMNVVSKNIAEREMQIMKLSPSVDIKIYQ
jgi:ankyrin repeat protein